MVFTCHLKHFPNLLEPASWKQAPLPSMGLPLPACTPALEADLEGALLELQQVRAVTV